MVWVISAKIRSQASSLDTMRFRDAIDSLAAEYWATWYQHVSGRAGGGDRVDTGLLVRAGLAAVPYLLRQRQWQPAAAMLEDAFNRDPSRANVATVVPALKQITRHHPRTAATLARVLAVTDPAAAEAQLRSHMANAAACGDYRAASVVAGVLINLCRHGGRLTEALDLAGQKADYTRQAGLGLWTQLGDQVQRLQVLLEKGRAGQVLDEVARLRDHMAALPVVPGPGEAVPPWAVREALLDIGRSAAVQLRRDADALALNAEVAASLRGRRAPATDIARAWFGDSGPLLRLGRADDAFEVLLYCRQVFQDARDTEMLGKTLTALAQTEHARGHGENAIGLQRDALRYLYPARNVADIAVSYHSLGKYLADHARRPAQALASHLTAALIGTLAGSGATGDSIQAAAIDLREFGTEAVPPADVADLCRQVGDIPGTDLPGLLAALSPDPATAEHALRDLVAQAVEQAAQTPPEAQPPS